MKLSILAGFIARGSLIRFLIYGALPGGLAEVTGQNIGRVSTRIGALPPLEPECRKNPSSLKLNHYCTAMVTGGLVWSAAVTTSGASGAGVIPGGTVAVT